MEQWHMPEGFKFIPWICFLGASALGNSTFFLTWSGLHKVRCLCEYMILISTISTFQALLGLLCPISFTSYLEASRQWCFGEGFSEFFFLKEVPIF